LRSVRADRNSSKPCLCPVVVGPTSNFFVALRSVCRMGTSNGRVHTVHKWTSHICNMPVLALPKKKLRLAWVTNGFLKNILACRQALSSDAYVTLEHRLNRYLSITHRLSDSRQIEPDYTDRSDIRKHSSYYSLIGLGTTQTPRSYIQVWCPFGSPFPYVHHASSRLPIFTVLPYIRRSYYSYLCRPVQISRPTLWHAHGTVFHTSNP
jgi:hypothetical protein